MDSERYTKRHNESGKPVNHVMEQRLSVIPLNAEWNKKTCNYWYLVQNNHAAHTAFNRRESLFRWLDERGLSLDESKLAPHMRGGDWLPIIGTYRECAHMSYDDFYRLQNVVVDTKTLSNGDYTMARITLDPDGIRTVHTLNCNCKCRPVYDYAACRVEVG